MFTNEFYIAARHIDKILQHINIYMTEKNNDMNYYSTN